jgi:hypothetical protein
MANLRWNRRSLGVSDVTPFSAFGQQLNYKFHGKHATIDGAKIIETDMPCANGIIHVIDDVILPAEKSLLELIKNQKRFSTLIPITQRDRAGSSFGVIENDLYHLCTGQRSMGKRALQITN